MTRPTRSPPTVAMKESAEVAALMWVAAPFSGGLVPLIVLIVSWSDRGSVLRQHALVATWLWAVMMAIYMPVFVIGWMYGSFTYGGPGPGAIAVGLAAVGTASSITGVIVALRRRTSQADRSGGAKFRSSAWAFGWSG